MKRNRADYFGDLWTVFTAVILLVATWAYPASAEEPPLPTFKPMDSLPVIIQTHSSGGTQQNATISGASTMTPATNTANPGLNFPVPSIPASQPPKDIDFGPYMAALQKKIKRNWFPPKGDETKRVSVVFKVYANGQMSNIRIVQSSGIASADQAALQACTLANPLDPLPEGSPPDVDIQFTFDYNVFKLPKTTSELRQHCLQAINSNDWKTVLDDCGPLYWVAQTYTREFVEFMAAYALTQLGEHERAAKVMSELKRQRREYASGRKLYHWVKYTDRDFKSDGIDQGPDTTIEDDDVGLFGRNSDDDSGISGLGRPFNPEALSQERMKQLATSDPTNFKFENGILYRWQTYSEMFPFSLTDKNLFAYARKEIQEGGFNETSKDDLERIPYWKK